MKHKKLAAKHLEALRLLALDKGFTHKAIGEKIGIHPPNVSRMLSGKHIPRYDLYLKLKDVIEKAPVPLP